MQPKPKIKQVDNVVKQPKQKENVEVVVSPNVRPTMGGPIEEVYKKEVMEKFLDEIESGYTLKELRKMYNFQEANTEEDWDFGNDRYADIQEALEKYGIKNDEDVEEVWQNIFKALGIAK